MHMSPTTGVTKRASRFLDAKGKSMVYKAFIRPCVEYAHLTWIGAAPTPLAALDAVQHSIEKMIDDDELVLDSLDHRRRVGALTYLYKLQCWDAPPKLQRLVPPRLSQPPAGKTRGSQLAHASWHVNKFENVLPLRSLAHARRAFPFGVIDAWNSLPA